MTKDNLILIKKVYDQLLAGVSNPQLINEAYKLLPISIEGTPMRGKIQAINRFVMFNYNDINKQINEKHVEEQPEVIETMGSIGTMENKPMQSHSEENYNGDNDDIELFLTTEEKEDLHSNQSGTEFVIESQDGKKKRNRTKK